MPYKDPAKKKEYMVKYREKNKEENKEYQANYHKNLNQHAYDCIKTGIIIDQNMWDMWCNMIKNGAATNNHPYFDDFTSDVVFEMMVQGCFYCGDIATSIDRINSKLGHTIDNCVGCCYGCNISKGASDPDTFMRKAYYRARGEYYDDNTDVWFVYKNKPIASGCNKKVPFELTKDDWDTLVVDECAYCHRSPTTWFGVDRVVPSLGYVLGNVASCCFDCNVDKLEDDVQKMRARNERIAQRIDDGELVIGDHDKVILHQGTHSSSMTVCARGKVYESQGAAAKAIEMNRSTFKLRIRDGKDPDIFAVSKEFYEEYKDSIENITKKMFSG